MARIARIVLPGRPHLVYQKASRAVHNSESRRQAYLEIFAEVAAAYKVKVLAWAVLPDRMAVVAVPPSAQALSACMQVAQARYTRQLRRAGFRGPIALQRFSSCPLDEQAALDAVKFVENMPVRRKLAARAAEYPFASAAVRVAGGSPLLAELPKLTGQIGRWLDWLDEPLPVERREYLAVRLRTGKPAGSPEFVQRVGRKVGRDLSRGRGRPPKSPRKA